MGEQGKAGADLNEQAIAWLVALDCGTADERTFHAWREADPRHAAAFAQAATTWRRTADPRLVSLLDQHEEREPEPEPASEPATPILSRRAAMGGGLAALLALGGAGAYMAWPRRAYATTAVGEQRTLRLPDGSHAMLNTDTRVSWRFADRRDFWIEQGEAALLVRETERPFRLYGDDFDARLNGGRFDIRLAERGGQLMVLAGQAAATYRGAPAGTIGAGSVLTMDDGVTRIAALGTDALGAATAWQSGRIVFNGMPLDRALAEFNRYLPDKIVLGQGDLGATRLGGEFRVDDPDTFLLALREAFDIDHRRQGDQILLFRAR